MPHNVFLIGMMNTADRSLALVDYALRRRFAFITVQPAFDHPTFAKYLEQRGVTGSLVSQIRSRMTKLNDEIAADRTNLGPGFRIGHSFFVPRDDEEMPLIEAWYQTIIETEISPLLEEYSQDLPDKIQTWRNNLLKQFD